MLSTRNLDPLPNVADLKRLMQSLAVLDAIMSPDFGFRYYSFDSKWSDTEEMGAIQDGSGDELFVLFNSAGCFAKGFAHESPMSPHRTDPPEIWPGVLDRVPTEFARALDEPAFAMENTTFGIWRLNSDHRWSRGPVEYPSGEDPDGSESILEMLDGDPQRYAQFAEDYFEETIPLEAIEHIYNHLALTLDVVESLNPEVSLEALKEDLVEIGYRQ